MSEIQIIAAVWAALFSAHIALRNLPSMAKENLTERFNSHNTDQGLGQSVSAQELASDFLNPASNSKLQEYCEVEGIDFKEYISSFKENFHPLLAYIKFYLYYIGTGSFFLGIFILILDISGGIYILICGILIILEFSVWLLENR